MAGAQEGKAEYTIEIRNAEGLHMRPAMQFVERASTYRSKISIFKEDQCVDGKSIMQVTMLAAVQGTLLRIEAEGEDAQEAVEALARVLEGEESKNVS